MQKINDVIKLAIFDVNQTIFSFSEIESRFLKKKLNPKIVDLWFTSVLKEGFALSELDTYVDFKVIAMEELKRTIYKQNLEVKKETLDYLFQGFKNLKAHSEIKESFKILKKNGIKIVTLTNGPKKNSIELLRNNDLFSYVDDCFSIEDSKKWKPNPEPYLKIINKFNFFKSEVIMIACHSWDLFGAKKIGLKTGYIYNYEKFSNEYYPDFNYIGDNALNLVKQITNQ